MGDTPRANDTAGPEARIFAARLRPHRSLDARRVKILLVAVGCVSGAVSLPFYLMGAWPVVGFMGLDVALLWLAFHVSMRGARAYEDVAVSALELLVAKVSAGGRRAEWRFHPAWVRLERVWHEAYGLERLSLVSRGRHLEVASFLGPGEKARFEREFSAALNQARRGPRFA
jgi:uncharacterized membrane protein